MFQFVFNFSQMYSNVLKVIFQVIFYHFSVEHKYPIKTPMINGLLSNTQKKKRHGLIRHRRSSQLEIRQFFLPEFFISGIDSLQFAVPTG